MVLAIILIILSLIIIFVQPVPDAVYSLIPVITFSVILFVIWISRWISASEFFYKKSFRLWVVPFIISAILLEL